MSFSPAITQTVFDMGLGDHVVGATSWCILPAGQARPVVGDLSSLNVEAVLAVRPDVLLAQSSLPNYEACKKVLPDLQIRQFKIERLADVSAMMLAIGQILEKPDAGKKAAKELAEHLDAVRRRCAKALAGKPSPRVLFVMEYQRPAVAGSDNFIHDLIELCGAVNAGSDVPGAKPWRDATAEMIISARPDILICQVFNPADSPAAKAFWSSLSDMPAAKTGRIYVVSDRKWSIPSSQIWQIAGELGEIIVGEKPK
ncbi:MAG: ABC transporter substrate-binding protein [Planctomycetes bacterium]|nr:ABC transporter substrate-binding protein [Planctomycetota bacterium]